MSLPASFPARYTIFGLILGLGVITLILWLAGLSLFFWPFLVLLILSGIGIRDMRQQRHAVLRNYPVIGHVRYMLESIRPEIRQYFLESNLDGTPFSREKRTLVYDRAKDIEANKPFGTEYNVYANNYAWVNHSMAPLGGPGSTPINLTDDPRLRITIGGPDCKQPYSASLYNISAMSFGSLSGNAIQALNRGAKAGGFAHDTGEGSVSRHHTAGGGDLIWELGSGYFGCRDENGNFDPEKFRKQAANDQIKMIEIKLSQGAKPGHGGVLPGSKVTEEIAEARGVPVGVECVSPSAHSAFSTPMELMHFIAQLRELSNGKPVGFKLCVGHKWEFMAVVKAMIESGIKPDFIVVDGAEGGTGAAPVEFSNRLGSPLRQGLPFVHNTLVGAGLRDDIKVGASGKLISAFDLAHAMAFGADWANSARGFMFAIGCIQSQSCHTNRCPTGVATQDPRRQNALVVSDKATRVSNFHHNTLKGLMDFAESSGLESPKDFRPEHIYLREGHRVVLPGSAAMDWLKPGELVADDHDIAGYSTYWHMADPSSFAPIKSVVEAKEETHDDMA